jgi:hypothetical protein
MDGAIGHDLGKAHPDFKQLLTKPGQLTTDEINVMRRHADESQKLLSQSPTYAHIAKIAGAHHLPASTSELASQIISVADIYEAMTEARPYKGGVSPAVALDELQRQASIGKLNQAVVNKFTEGIKAGDYKGIATGRKRFTDYGWFGGSKLFGHVQAEPSTPEINPANVKVANLKTGQASEIPAGLLTSAPKNASMIVLDKLTGEPHWSDDMRRDLGVVKKSISSALGGK